MRLVLKNCVLIIALDKSVFLKKKRKKSGENKEKNVQNWMTLPQGEVYDKPNPETSQKLAMYLEDLFLQQKLKSQIFFLLVSKHNI